MQKLHPNQVAWLKRIADSLPGMVRTVAAGQRQELRLGERRRPDGVRVEVRLVVTASEPPPSPMGSHGVIIGEAANDSD